MPIAEKTISDETASGSITPRRPRVLKHWPELERRISSEPNVIETLQSLEFSFDDFGDETITNRDEVLGAILAGADIKTSLSVFFDHFRTDFRHGDITAATRTVGYPNDLFKREPFFGVVTPFHVTAVAVAIRKRPDLMRLMAEWYRVFESLHFDDFPEAVPTDISKAADGILRDVLKFAKFKQSKLATMTAMVGQDIYQIRWRGNNEIDALASRRVDPAPGGKRQFLCMRHNFALESLSEGLTLSASLLIHGNRVLAMGTDDTTAVNQIFQRDNLHNLFLAEHIFPTEEPSKTDQSPEPQKADVKPDSFGFEDSSFHFEMAEESNLPRHATKPVPLTEEFYDLIEQAVDQLCCGTRAILTAWVLITDNKVRIFSYEGDRLWKHGDQFSMAPKVDEMLLRSLKFADFEQEIAEIGIAADNAVERRLLAGCLEHLEFDESDRLDPVKEKMVEILVSAVKDHFTKIKMFQNLQARWDTIVTARQDGELFMKAVSNRRDAKMSRLTGLQGE